MSPSEQQVAHVSETNNKTPLRSRSAPKDTKTTPSLKTANHQAYSPPIRETTVPLNQSASLAPSPSSPKPSISPMPSIPPTPPSGASDLTSPPIEMPPASNNRVECNVRVNLSSENGKFVEKLAITFKIRFYTPIGAVFVIFFYIWTHRKLFSVKTDSKLQKELRRSLRLLAYINEEEYELVSCFSQFGNIWEICEHFNSIFIVCRAKFLSFNTDIYFQLKPDA